MKKLTLLVAGLAMGLASAFAASAPCAEATASNGAYYTYNGSIEGDVVGKALANNAQHNWGDMVFPNAAGFNFLKVEYTGDLTSLRFDNGKKFVDNAIAEFSDDASDATEAQKTIWLDLGAMGVKLNDDGQGNAKNDSPLVYGSDGENTNTFTIVSLTAYDKDPNCSSEQGEADPVWTSQDGSVKVYKINVDGYDFGDVEHPNPCYWYNTYANAWMEDYPAANQNFTFAIEAKDDENKAFCDYAGAGDAIPSFGVHIWDFRGEAQAKDQTNPKQSGDFRVERINEYVYGVDMNVSTLKADFIFEQGVCGADPSMSEIWFNVTLAFIGDETAAGETGAWGTTNTGTLNLDLKAAMPTADVMPAASQDWIDRVGTNLTAGINAFGTTTGIEDVIADSIESGKAIKAIIDGNVVIVKGDEVFSILGAKIK